MTKPEAEDDIASGEENHGYYPGTEKYTLYLALANKRLFNLLV
jgi:hypothetical protein